MKESYDSHMFGNVTLHEWEPNAQKPPPVPKDGAFVVFHLHMRPEIPWSDDPSMIMYSGEKLGIALGAGVIKNRAEVVRLRNYKFEHDQVQCHARFETVREARRVFQRMIDGGFVDIYLYKNGVIHDEYD